MKKFTKILFGSIAIAGLIVSVTAGSPSEEAPLWMSMFMAILGLVMFAGGATGVHFLTFRQ